jgi:hypothetical protein
MIRLSSLALVLGIFFAGMSGMSGVQAMPAAPLDQMQSGITVPVAGGCGAGWHRGPGGGCRRNGYYGGVYIGAPVVVAPGPIVVEPGPCGGRGTHRVCNGYGRCWRVCN